MIVIVFNNDNITSICNNVQYMSADDITIMNNYMSI